jgi:transposase-like protein
MKGIVQRISNGKASWASVGRDYGVSDNAVRKWAKKYNLL